MTLVEAVRATYAVIGQDVNDAALVLLVNDLEAYPEADVLAALTRCRKELRKLTLADILDRLPNEHPKVEEAWAIVSRCLDNEDVSIVWTDEMASACGVARHLIEDKVAARMAFKEAYAEAVGKARANNTRPNWRVSLGFDRHGRETAIQEAVEKGRISVEHAAKLLPDFSMPENITLPAIKGF